MPSDPHEGHAVTTFNWRASKFSSRTARIIKRASQAAVLHPTPYIWKSFVVPGTHVSTSSLTSRRNYSKPAAKAPLPPRTGRRDSTQFWLCPPPGPHAIWQSSPDSGGVYGLLLSTRLSALDDLCAKVCFWGCRRSCGRIGLLCLGGHGRLVRSCFLVLISSCPI